MNRLEIDGITRERRRSERSGIVASFQERNGGEFGKVKEDETRSQGESNRVIVLVL